MAFWTSTVFRRSFSSSRLTMDREGRRVAFTWLFCIDAISCALSRTKAKLNIIIKQNKTNLFKMSTTLVYVLRTIGAGYPGHS
eukprot:15366917-Ditylum_brightwellii.AAC.2